MYNPCRQFTIPIVYKGYLIMLYFYLQDFLENLLLIFLIERNCPKEVLDWGAKYKGYCSDNTRTIVFSEKQQEIFDIVLEAHDKTIESIKEGMKACEVDKIARDIIAEYGYGDKYIHSTGHSLGLDIHENPNVSTRTETGFATPIAYAS